MESVVKQLIEQTIPIYTHNNPNPETRKVDCPLVRQHKEGMRTMMKSKIDELVKYYGDKATDKGGD